MAVFLGIERLVQYHPPRIVNGCHDNQQSQ